MKQNNAQVEAPLVLRHFIGDKTPYGVGDCFLWEHKVPTKNLKYSSSILRKAKFCGENISLSDIIEWKDFQIKSFGKKPSADKFKVNLAWKSFCILLIEIGFCVSGLNPDIHVIGMETVENIESNSHNPDLNDNSDVESEPLFLYIQSYPF